MKLSVAIMHHARYMFTKESVIWKKIRRDYIVGVPFFVVILYIIMSEAAFYSISVGFMKFQ